VPENALNLKKFYMKSLLLIAVLFFSLMGCSEKEKEDIVNEVPKDGSIETSVKVDHLNDSMDLLMTTHKIYKNSTDWRIRTTTDTIPALGTTTVKDENNNNTTVKKDYDIFITVK
jgi:uncharacterized protein YcfL